MKTLKLEVIFGAVDKLSPALKLLVAGSKGFNQALRGMQKELKSLQNQTKMIEGFKKQKQAVQESARALQDIQQKIKALHQQMRQNPNDSGLARTYQKALQEAKKLKETHKQNQAMLQRMRQELRQAGISTNTLSDHQRRLSQSIRQTNDNIREQEAIKTFKSSTASVCQYVQYCSQRQFLGYGHDDKGGGRCICFIKTHQ